MSNLFKNRAPVPNGNVAIETFDPHFSVVVFKAAKVGAGPFTFTFPKQQLKAFGYGQANDMDVAGAPGRKATSSETSILAPGQTTNNEDVMLHSLHASIAADAAPEVVRALFDNINFALQLGPNMIRPLGRIEFAAAQTGLTGSAEARSLPGALDNAGGKVISSLANGLPVVGGGIMLGDIMWRGYTSQTPDTSLNILVNLTKDIVITAPADRVAAAGVEAFTVPDTLDVALTVWFENTRRAPRSGNG